MSAAVRVTVHVWMSAEAGPVGALALQRSIGAAFHMPVQRLVVPSTEEQVYVVDLLGWTEPLSAACVAVEQAVLRGLEALPSRRGTEMRSVAAEGREG